MTEENRELVALLQLHPCCRVDSVSLNPDALGWLCLINALRPGLEVIKLEFLLKLKIKHNDWLLADTCPQAANRCTLF